MWVGEIVGLYYHRVLNMPYIITGVKATLEYSTMRSPFICTAQYLIQEHVIVTLTAYPVKRYNLRISLDNLTASKI
jgi:hypothetical protein